MLQGLFDGVYKSPGTAEIIALIRQPPLTRHRSRASRIVEQRRYSMKVSSTLARLLALVWFLCVFCDAVSEVAPNGHRRFRNRLPSRGYAVEELIAEDEDSMELNKRQLFDDYGHMRFGKRDRFDDYGHMRFGRNHE